MKVHKEKGEGEVRWWYWRRIDVNKNSSNNLTKKSILLRQNILPAVPIVTLMEPITGPNHSHLVKSPTWSLLHPNHVLWTIIKPLNAIKLTENQSPTTKNVIKFITSVNDFIKVHRKKNAHRQPYPDSSMKKRSRTQPYVYRIHNLQTRIRYLTFQTRIQIIQTYAYFGSLINQPVIQTYT